MAKDLVKPLDYFASNGTEENIPNHEQRIHKYSENIKEISNKEKATERLLAVDIILAKLNQEINEFIKTLIPAFLLFYVILVLFSLAIFIYKKSIYTTRRIYYEAYRTLLTQHINAMP